MKKTRIKYTLAFVLIVAALFTNTTYAHAATGRQLAQNAIASLQSVAPTTTTKNVVTLSWSWFEVNFNDETYPLTVDFVGSNFANAQKVIYLLPGGGVNFNSSFFTPIGNNLAHFFRDAGYLVVGITPREDNVPSGIPYDFMAGWGMAEHKADIQKIIGIVQARTKLPYWVLGHSFGAAYALDYASTCTDNLFQKVIALDIYSYNESGDAASSQYIFQQLIAAGQYVDPTYTDLKSLMLISLLLPKVDSGEPRTPYPGDFTYQGLLYFSLIWSSELPGIDITDWPLVQSYAAGVYRFSINPLFDTYFLTYTDINLLRDASFKVGSGLVPYAVYRDYFDVNGYNINYSINWSGIRVPLLWVNSQLGYGKNAYSGGIPKTFKVIPGYGHLDLLGSSTAQGDVWNLFLK
jgi:pimeloyl-ACP methyl ester carboxylesterase